MFWLEFVNESLIFPVLKWRHLQQKETKAIGASLTVRTVVKSGNLTYRSVSRSSGSTTLWRGRVSASWFPDLCWGWILYSSIAFFILWYQLQKNIINI